MGGPGGGGGQGGNMIFPDYKLAFDNLPVTRGNLGVSNGELQFADTLGFAKMFTKHGGRAERGDTIVYEYNGRRNFYVENQWRFPICGSAGAWWHVAPGFESAAPGQAGIVFIPSRITQEMCNQ
jgi:hypothetical protein